MCMYIDAVLCVFMLEYIYIGFTGTKRENVK